MSKQKDKKTLKFTSVRNFQIFMKVAQQQIAQEFELATVQKLIHEAIPMAGQSKVELLEFSRGHVVMKMPIEGNTNHLNTMYAGALFTLAELPGGAILMSAFDMSKFFPTLGKIETKFTAPAKTAVTVEVNLSEEELTRIGEEAKTQGKSVFVLELDLKDENGVVVAQTKGTY